MPAILVQMLSMESMKFLWLLLPHGFVVAVCVLLGLIVGSFLNVVIYRFNTGKSLNGRSRCLSCGHTLSWATLFPMLSYLMLRGRCAYCGSRISPRYMLVELLTAMLFGGAALLVQDPLLLGLYLVLAALFVLVVVYDLLHTIIPDLFVVLTTVVGGAIAVYAYVGDGDAYGLLLRLLGAAVGFLFFASLWLISQGRWIGLGDAKLALPLGLIASFPAVVSVIVLSFWIGAVVSIALLVLQKIMRRGQQRLPFLRTSLTIKSEIPFAPFLIAGFLLVHFFAFNAFTFIASLLVSTL